MYSHPGFGVIMENILRFLEQVFKARADPTPKSISPSCLSSLIPQAASESGAGVSALCVSPLS